MQGAPQEQPPAQGAAWGVVGVVGPGGERTLLLAADDSGYLLQDRAG
jgi:hypothetical protein